MSVSILTFENTRKGGPWGGLKVPPLSSFEGYTGTVLFSFSSLSIREGLRTWIVSGPKVPLLEKSPVKTLE